MECKLLAVRYNCMPSIVASLSCMSAIAIPPPRRLASPIFDQPDNGSNNPLVARGDPRAFPFLRRPTAIQEQRWPYFDVRECFDRDRWISKGLTL